MRNTLSLLLTINNKIVADRMVDSEVAGSILTVFLFQKKEQMRDFLTFKNLKLLTT